MSGFIEAAWRLRIIGAENDRRHLASGCDTHDFFTVDADSNRCGGAFRDGDRVPGTVADRPEEACWPDGKPTFTSHCMRSLPAKLRDGMECTVSTSDKLYLPRPTKLSELARQDEPRGNARRFTI